MNSGRSPGSNSPDSTPKATLWGIAHHHWLRGLAMVGGGVLLGAGVLGWLGWNFLRRELPPFLEDNISAALGRPLRLGEFERFSLAGMRFGESILPPTADNFTWAKARAVDISFNPWSLLFSQTLRPTIILVEPEVAIKQGFDRQWQVQAPNSAETEGLIATELNQIQIRNANLAIGPVARRSIIPTPQGVTSSALILLQNVNLRVNFSGPDNQTASFVVGGRLNNGAFQLRGAGQLDTRQLNLLLRSQQIPINTVNPLLGGHLFVRDGMLSTNLDLQVRPGTAEPVALKGTARLRNGDVVITDLPSAITSINGTLVFDGVGAKLEKSSLKYGPIWVDAWGRLDGNQGYDLQVAIPDMSVAQLEEAFAQPLPVATEGRFRIDTAITGQLLDPQIAGTLRSLGELQIDRLGIDAVTAAFTADRRHFRLEDAEVRPATGGRLTAQGQADFSQDLLRPDLTFTARTDLPLDAIATLYNLPRFGGLRLGSLLAEARLSGQPDDFQAVARWTLPQATVPGTGRLSYADSQLQLRQTRFQVGGGALTVAADANLNTQAWTAQITGTEMDLAALSARLQGQLTAAIQAAGRLSALTLAETRAQGRLQLSPAIPLADAGLDTLIPGALQADFTWSGDTLQVPQLQAGDTLYASGSAAVATTESGLPAISRVDFDTRLRGLDLGAADSLLPVPEWLDFSGLVDFDGQLSGRWPNPQLVGQLGLQQVAINDLALAPQVSGPIQASPRDGARIDLRGGTTALYADIDASLLPNQFRFINGDLRVIGQRQGTLLTASVHNFELGELGLRPFEMPNLGTLSGLLQANARIDLTDIRDPDLQVGVAIATPTLGPIAADRFTGQIAYADGAARLSTGRLQITPETVVDLTASGRLRPDWSLAAQLTTDNAQIQDLLGLIGLYRFSDIGQLFGPEATGSAADLVVEPSGDPQAPLPEQAQLVQVYRDERLAVEARTRQELLPDLDQLEGRLSGTATLKASSAQGISARFDFSGQNWVWGPYDFDNQFVARGQLTDRRLQLDPLEFRAGDTRLALTGTASLDDSQLQFRAEHLPLATFAEVATIPIHLDGDLNLAADLTGPLTNPQMVGQLSVDNPQVNQQPLQTVSSQFQYREALFSLQGRIQNQAPEPLLFSGTIPYALPFMTVQPASDQIDLRASLKNEALSLVNLLTPAITWDGGQARIDLRVQGTLPAPSVTGVAIFQGATFNSPLLAAELAQLNGSLRFSENHLRSEGFSGSLLGGQFSIRGQISLYPEAAAPDKQLTLNLDTLSINYANEVTSRIDGQLRLANALLAPQIGGVITLRDTYAQIGPELGRLVNATVADPRFVADAQALLAELETFPAQFSDLRVILEPAQVKVAPLLYASAAGDVVLRGPLTAPVASGEILVADAWLNTITTEFNLVRSHNNRIVFTPEQGLNPYLDLWFVALVPLQRNYNLKPPLSTGTNAEIPDLSSIESSTIFDELQVDARIQGSASDLLGALSLTSNPPRSQTELLTMVTGGYLQDLGGGEPSLALLSNLLATLGADTQDQIAQALGIRRLRLTASTVLPSEGGDTLGYGIGLNVGVTENLSTTFLQVLNQSQPYQFNLRYRLTDELGISGSTNFGDEHRLFFEYRINF